MTVDFLSTLIGLKAKFRIFLDNAPSNFKVTWDYGDGESETFDNKLTTSHLYSKTGEYKVKLTINDSGTESMVTKVVFVSDNSKTQLPDSIYNLIDTYIPPEIFGKLSLSEKQNFIEKWQLYIQPLVDHEIPLDEFNNESYYEALENQLIMQLAAYDYMVLQVSLMIGASTESITNDNSQDPDATVEGEVKRIQTGPSEVEYFNAQDGESKTSANIIRAMKPGGVIDILKQNICMLADRLDIYLPICRAHRTTVVPEVVNRRDPQFLDGPDPLYPLK